MTDSQVLLDAARMLGVGQRILKQLAKTTTFTPEYKQKLINEVIHNINAALARLQ